MGQETDIQTPAVNPFLPTEAMPAVRGEKGEVSRESLLLRAAELGPQRPTWETIGMVPTDPILGQKMQPRVIERRARFRRMVKVALGVCVGFCLVGAASSALSSSPQTASADSGAKRKTAPAVGATTVEKLEVPALGKAPARHVTAAVRPPPVPKFGAKRR